MGSRTADHLGAIGEDPAEDDDCNSDTETVASQNTEGNRDGANFLTRPYWLSDDGLKKGEVDVLSLQEELFWKDLLEKYLYPIDEDKAEKVKQSKRVHEFIWFSLSYILIKFDGLEKLEFIVQSSKFLIFLILNLAIYIYRRLIINNRELSALIINS